jgi:hypothetical protein
MSGELNLAKPVTAQVIDPEYEMGVGAAVATPDPKPALALTTSATAPAPSRTLRNMATAFLRRARRTTNPLTIG